MPEKAPDVVVSEIVDAPPATVWELVGDPARIGEISPETYAVRWLGGASGPKPGARFIGWNRKGLLRWPTTSTIAEYEPERTISWDVDVVGQSVARWSFTLEPEGRRTRDRPALAGQAHHDRRAGRQGPHQRQPLAQPRRHGAHPRDGEARAWRADHGCRTARLAWRACEWRPGT